MIWPEKKHHKTELLYSSTQFPRRLQLLHNITFTYMCTLNSINIWIGSNTSKKPNQTSEEIIMANKLLVP